MIAHIGRAKRKHMTKKIAPSITATTANEHNMQSAICHQTVHPNHIAMPTPTATVTRMITNAVANKRKLNFKDSIDIMLSPQQNK